MKYTTTPTYLFSLYTVYIWKKISVGGVVYFTVMFDHPSCFLTFCRSGIPTSCYILNVFYYLLLVIYDEYGDDNNYYLQVAELASLAQLLSPRSPTVRNPAPDSSLCRAAPRLRPLQLLLAACVASAAAPRPDCGIRFNCCSSFASASSCCSPIAPASAAAHCLRPLQLLLPIASASTAAP